jgi:two-component system response regulator NreC
MLTATHAHTISHSQRTISLVILDSYQIMADGLAKLLGTASGFQVLAAEVASSDSVSLVARLQPSLVLVDPVAEPILIDKLLRTLSIRLNESHLVVLTEEPTDRLLEQIVQYEVSCLSKAVASHELIEYLQRADAGERCYSPTIAERLIVSRDGVRVKRRSALAMLTDRQIEVLRQIALGHRVKDIAKQMHLSTKSVESHKYRIMNRLGMRDRVELALYAVREKLI